MIETRLQKEQYRMRKLDLNELNRYLQKIQQRLDAFGIGQDMDLLGMKIVNLGNAIDIKDAVNLSQINNLIEIFDSENQLRMWPPGRDGEDGEDAWVIPGKDGAIGPSKTIFILGQYGQDREDGEDVWPIPGPPGISVQGSPGISIPGRDGEDAEDNCLSLRMGAHGSFGTDDHPQYNQYGVVVYGATGNITTTALRGQVGKITGAFTLSLPTATINYHGSFFASTAAVFSIDVLTATDIIILDGVALLAAHKATSDGTLGAKIFIECTEVGFYRATSILGVFADGGL